MTDRVRELAPDLFAADHPLVVGGSPPIIRWWWGASISAPAPPWSARGPG
jgi:hypothetical protein